jgi:hypothetical protein
MMPSQGASAKKAVPQPLSSCFAFTTTACACMASSIVRSSMFGMRSVRRSFTSPSGVVSRARMSRALISASFTLPSATAAMSSL